MISVIKNIMNNHQGSERNQNKSKKKQGCKYILILIKIDNITQQIPILLA